MTTITAPGTPIRRALIAQLGVDTAYVLVGFPLAIIAFVVVVTGISLGLGLVALMLIGIPILIGTLFLARGLAEAERSRLTPVLGRPRTHVRYRRARPDDSALRRMLAPLGDVQYWLDGLHAVVRLPISTVGFSVVLSWWVTALASLTYGLWGWALPQDPDQDLPELLGFADTTTNRIVVYLVIGIVFAVTLPFVVRLFALVEAWLAHGLLNGTAELRQDEEQRHTHLPARTSHA